MPNELILIVEDDKHISKLVKYNLEKAGFQCAVTITGEDALKLLDRQPVDLVVLDIMLPKMDGLETCKQIKSDQSLRHIPIIMLTARGEEVDRVVGLELGVDDYIVKPFSIRELVLRVRNVLKRRQPQASDSGILAAGMLMVDIARHEVTIDKKKVVLTSMEFKLLVTLLQRKGRVQSREQLLGDVWQMDAVVTTRTIDTHIKCLRQKLGQAGEMIETVRGHGYKLRDDD